MFKKLSTRILLIVLVVLAAIVIIIRLTDKEDRTFRSKVLEYDPEAITAMEINEPDRKGIIRVESGDGETWKVNHRDREYLGDRDAIRNLIFMLNDLQTQRVAGTREDVWGEYQVADTNGILVTLYEDGQKTGEIMVGKFTYKMSDQPQQMPGQQQNATMTSYVRPVEEDNVYAVNGILRMSFTGGPEYFRNKELVGQDAKTFETVRFTFPESSFTLEKQGGKWHVDNAVADSTKTLRYLKSIGHLRNSGYVGANIAGRTPTHQISIQGKGFDPIDIHAYPAPDTAIGHYITSSIDPGTVWNGSKAKLFEKLFKNREAFTVKGK
ncbi:MAG: DUF4340 domain-containing protein [Bacteroidales bacterium]